MRKTKEHSYCAAWFRSTVQMVRGSATGAVDSGLIRTLVKSVSVKFTASLLDAQHQRNSVENKPASLLVVLLGKAFSGFPHVGVVDRWPATSKRARYCALIAFL